MSKYTMDEERLYRLVQLAHRDVQADDLRRARDRLRSVLHDAPHFVPALELMGLIYYKHEDYRNAVMHWARAGYHQDPMPDACDQVFKAISRALVREDAKIARHYLYAFAGCSLPYVQQEKLSALRTAYYRLGSKKTKLAGLACAPISGGCLLAILGLATVLLGAGWQWFIYMGVVALATTIIVGVVNILSYTRASRLFREAISAFRSPTGK